MTDDFRDFLGAALVSVQTLFERRRRLDRFVIDGSLRGWDAEGAFVQSAPRARWHLHFEVPSPCRLVDFIVEPSCSRYFDVRSLRIGLEEQLVEPVPATAFDALVTHRVRPWRNAPPCVPHRGPRIEIENVSRAPREFRARFVMEALP